MRQLGALCGVSVAAVSKAFNNHPSIPPATKEMILRKAQEVGYVPNPEISRLMRAVAEGYHEHNKPTVAVLFPWSRKQDFSEESDIPTIQMIWKGLHQCAREMGYRLDCFWLGSPHMSGKRLVDIFTARGLEALIIFSCPQGYKDVSIDFSKFSVVAIGHLPFDPSPVTIEVDAFAIGTMALKKLRQLGYRRPGFILMDADLEQDEGRRYSAFHYLKEEFFSQQPPIPDILMQTSHVKPWSLPSASEIDRLIGWVRKYKPDVVVSTFNEVKDWLVNSGFSVPQDVGFVSLNNPQMFDNSGTVIDWDYVGRKAMLLMDGLLSKYSRGVPHTAEIYTIAPAWFEGGSLASAKQAGSQCRPSLRKKPPT